VNYRRRSCREPFAHACMASSQVFFIVGTDPVKTGLVASFNQPGGNVTGVSFFSNELAAKRLGLLHELLPQAKVIAVLINPKFPDALDRLTEIQDAARALRLQVRIFNASTESEIDASFADVALRQTDALVIAADPFFTARRHHILALAERHTLPAIYDLSTGGLISYGTDLGDAFRQSGIYTGRILKGTKPADLPVMQSAKYELVVNLKTAKALGLTVPATLLARADEVIE
jgi:putative tryptophan/tyrosine transport system substrate-binding protein